MHSDLLNDTVVSFTIDDIQIFLLLLADDTVLFSYSKEGLQHLLNKLYNYCKNWGIVVNVHKTVAMTFKTGNRNDDLEVYYNNERLKVVKSFTYLGVTLSSNGNCYQAQKSLSNQALKALFSLNSLFDFISLNVSERLDFSIL
jgi:hypothetical protein